MGKVNLESMTPGELVLHFATLAIEQDHAGLYDDIPRVNRLYDQLKMIETELKARGEDQRTALLTLYTHPDAQVRLRAALAALAVAANHARAVLQEIIERNEYPQLAE